MDRFWPRSLIARILIAEVAAILFVAILLPLLMVALLRQQVNRYEAQTLTEQAGEIGRGLSEQRGRLVVALSPDLAQTYATPYDGRAFVVTDGAGQTLSRSAFADRRLWQAAPRASASTAFRTGTIVGVSRPVEVGGRRLWIIVIQDEAGRGAIIDDVARAFLTRYCPILLAILLLLPLINTVMIRRLLVAVRTVSAQAASIGPKTLDVRLDAADLPLEVAPLTDATNALLVRLQDSFQQQSEFAANVAHELRTPLTTLKFEIEGVEDEALRQRLTQTADRLTHVIDQLLALTALEVTAESFTRFDLVGMAREVTAELVPQILANGDVVDFAAPEAPVEIRASRTLIALALSNLISNATRHTPAGTTISVRVSTRPSIEVSDNGPGLSASARESAHHRYWRADNKRSDSAGLGLSIVGRIMDVHDARLDIASRPGGGSRFVLVLPGEPD